MSSGFNVLIDYTIFSRCFIVFQLFDTIKNFFSGYIEIDIFSLRLFIQFESILKSRSSSPASGAAFNFF